MPPSDSRTLATDVLAIISELEAIVDAETEALKQGHIATTARLTEAKAAASARYQAALASIRDLAAPLPLQMREELRRRHQLLERVLQRNLAVLATLRTVAEGLLRDVSTQMAPSSTGAYGPGGRAAPTASAPVSLSLKT